MGREIEFEFHEGGEGEGQFLACGNVLSSLRDHINRGEADAAARLYASCTENVGDDLWNDLKAGASAQATLTAAKMFQLARDFRRAALCAEKAGDAANAAALYEADYDFGKAAPLFLQANNPSKAAELFEKNRDFTKAGELYFKLGDLARAAECFERGGSLVNAGKLFIRVNRWDRAVEALQRVEGASPAFVEAAWLLGNIHERTKRVEDAMRQYLAVVKSRPVDKATVEIYFRLGQLFAARKSTANATTLFQKVRAFDPSFKEVAKELQALTTTPSVEPKPLSLEAPAQKPSDRLIGIDPDFEFLKGLPLFSELSLDELRQVHMQAEKARFAPGEALIRQGTAGIALFILIRGKVRVSTRDAGGKEVVLVDLGPGAHVGEMALIDDGATSADVVAVEETHVFKLARARFGELLTTQDRIALRFYRTFVRNLVMRLRETNRKLQTKTT